MTVEESTISGSLRERILAADDIEVEEAFVKQWNETVEVRGMTGNDRADYLEKFSMADGKIDYHALFPALIIATVYDPDSGQPVFNPGDEDLINTKSGSALDFLSKISLRVSGISGDSEDEAGKDSSKTENSDSSSS